MACIHSSIKHVYLTRKISTGFWQQKWLPVANYCKGHGISAQPLLTPSGSARFHMPKLTDIALRDFTFEQWQNSWHPL
jgi:hypothetical protein